MDDSEYMELMWENDQVLMRGLATSSSCTSYTSHPIKNVNEVENDSDGYTTKRLKKGTGDSILGDFPSIGDRELAKRDKSRQDDHHLELFPGLCETNFNMFSENNVNNIYDKHITEAHVVPGYKNASPLPGNSSEFAAEVPQLTTASNSQLYQSLLEQRKALVPIFHGLLNSKLQQVDSRPDNHSGLQNFSPILRPSLPKPNQGSDATRPTSGPGSSRFQQLKSNADEPPAGCRNLDESGQMVPTYVPEAFKYFHDQQDLLASQIVPTGPIARSPEASPPDEHSEAVLRNNAITSKRCCDRVVGSTSGSAEKTIKGKHYREKSIDQLASTTSICSRGSSNDPTSSGERRYEDTEGTTYTSDDVEEEEQPARGSAGSKRRRATEIHSLSERRRRDKINEKMRALQDLIPNSNKVDKASMLDQAIDYLKSLQFQLQIMSIMRTGLCMPPMMLPTAMQHMMIGAPQLAQFFPMGVGPVGMDMRLMHMGVGCSPATFPASALFGLPAAQMVPMSVSQAPFFPLNIGGHSTHSSVPMPAMSGLASSTLEFLRSAVFPSSKDTIHSNTLAHER